MPDFLVNNNFIHGTTDNAQPIIVEDSHELRAVFSISASNSIEGSAWLVKNGQLVKSSLGTLSFSIRDKDGTDIGLAGAGLIADSNGLYKLGPLSAVLLQDLTHYTVELLTNYLGDNIQGVVAITLGE